MSRNGRRIRVAICITSLEVGGAETVLAEMLRLLPSDVEVKVFSLLDGGGIADRIAGMGIPVEGLHMREGTPSLRAFALLVSRLREYRPDIVHTWMYHADLMGGLAARLTGVKRVMWHLHNSDLSPERTRRLTRAVVRACAFLSRSVPSVILSCSQAGVGVHTALGYAAEKFVVVPNGVDAERFSPDAEARSSVRAEFGLPDAAPLVGLIARVDPQKNHRGFFEAAKAYFSEGGTAYFLLAGRGVTEDDWQMPKWRDETGRPDHIILAGPRPDVPRIMASLDVATSSSLGEAFPIVLIEAMASGAPCVATDVGDCRLIVDDTGEVVPADDPRALADGWSRLLELPPYQRAALGARARERVIANYTIDKMAERVWGFYRSMVTR